MFKKFHHAISFLLIGIFCISCTQNEKVYEWRGKARAGIYCDTNLMKTWPEGGPELVWEYDGIGNGYGSPVFTNDNWYITGEIDDMACLFAFGADGQLLWKKDFGDEWVKNYDGSRSAPTIAGDMVYVTSGMGNLYCFDRYSGEEQWHIGMKDDLNGQYPLFGYSEAVVVDGDLVFCTPGGRDTNVVALNRFSGEIEWINKGTGQRPGYNQPKLIELPSRHIFVTFTAYEMLGIDTQTGELLWKHDQTNTQPEDRKPGTGDTHSNTVLFEDGYIYYAEGDGNGGVKLELSEDGASITQIWHNPEFDSFMGGIVKLGNHLYGCGAAKRDFRCVNATTGETEQVLKINSGAVISDGEMLYYYNFAGEAMLITPDPGNMEVIGKFRMKKGDKEHFAHPVINNGKLYVRHGHVIQAYNIKD